VQYWTGSTWTTVPGGSVSGNNKVWKKISFAPLTTSKIRISINGSVDGWSRVVEVEAWTGNPSNINWLVPDHLGTPRIILDQTGSFANLKRHDYLPFGEELSAGTGGRTPAMGYVSGDGVRQQFTSKERDMETGLDYFNARYYTSMQGRFTGSDPLMESGRASLPQSWNRYSYVLNNPLSLIDPNGLDNDNPQDSKKKNDPPPKPAETLLPKVTVRKSTDPRATNGTEPKANVLLPNGKYVTGVIAPLTITITDEAGNPLQGLTVTETNRLIKANPSLPFEENKSNVTTDANGSFTDLVFGNAIATPSKVSPEEATKIVQHQIESPTEVVTEQTLTIAAPNRGIIATAVYQRTFTNLDEKGNRRPAFDSSGRRHVNNFSISVTPVTVSHPKSP
jgi:RHS repeat-associated protein